MKLKYRTSTVVFIVITLLAIIGGNFILQRIKPQQQQDYLIEGGLLSARNEWIYVLEDVDATYPKDKRILKVNRASGQREVLIESIKTVLPELRDHPLLTLSKIGESPAKIFFVESLATHDSPCKLFSFDIALKDFKEMNIGEYFCGKYCLEGFCGLGITSPDTTKILMPSQDEDSNGRGLSRILWLLDLNRDEARAIVELSGAETLNKSYSGDYASFDIKWVNDKALEYAVYDQSKITSAAIDKPLIEIRRIEL